jgi:hypothetical protein
MHRKGKDVPSPILFKGYLNALELADFHDQKGMSESSSGIAFCSGFL